MRELSEKEIREVWGAGAIAEAAAELGAFGSVVGYIADRSLTGFTRGGAAGTLLGASFGIGYTTGTALYDWWVRS